MDNKILIIIHGGAAHVLRKPKGIELEIRDYDIEGIDAEEEFRCQKDSDGDLYQEMMWDEEEIV